MISKVADCCINRWDVLPLWDIVRGCSATHNSRWVTGCTKFLGTENKVLGTIFKKGLLQWRLYRQYCCLGMNFKVL